MRDKIWDCLVTTNIKIHSFKILNIGLGISSPIRTMGTTVSIVSHQKQHRVKIKLNTISEARPHTFSYN